MVYMWKEYVQNVRAVPSYNRIINGARGRESAGNYTVAMAQAWQRC